MFILLAIASLFLAGSMTQQLLKSTYIVSLMTLFSRIIGFVRDMVLANLFGASAGLDAFLMAFKIPNFMRRLFAEGAFSQSFVPVLSEYRTCQSDIKPFVNKVFSALSVVLMGVTILGVVAAPFFIQLFAPGFEGGDERFELAVRLLRLTFPYLFFISLTAFASGIQNAYQQFAVPALTPVLLNVCLIMAAIFSGYFTPGVMALAWGVLLAGVLQFLVQWPFLAKLNLVPSFQWDWQDAGVKRVLKLMVPALIGASVMQINLLVDTIFASFLPVGSLTWLYYSERLLEFPIGVFGVALATVVLPHLSQEYAQKSQNGFSASIDWALRWILLIGVPATIGLVWLAGPVLTTLFQYGHFTAQDVLMAERSLIALSLGLTCFLAVKVLVSAFYARQNTKFPVKVALLAMLINVGLNFVLIGPLAHAGLALASSLSSIFNVLILLAALMRQRIYVPLIGWRHFGMRLVLANSGMVAILWCVNVEINQWLEWDTLARAVYLLMIIVAAMVTYFATLWLSGLRGAHLRLSS